MDTQNEVAWWDSQIITLPTYWYLEGALGELECPVHVGSVMSSLFQSCVHGAVPSPALPPGEP